ncbi:MAG TPA: phytoene/squalene synthase family protein [Bacteroidetes bacterium]|nr:phytoene/squalene synthase family protein [Bacteroidota bacterium]
MSVDFYLENCYRISKLITNQYSTSFSLATSFLPDEKKRAIYAIYGFVRLADEIVDSFHGYDQTFLLDELNKELNYAITQGISINTVLTAFADTVKKYHIKQEHIQAFMKSMKNDLSQTTYTSSDDLNNYIYGSADVVGLMCLKVFCDGDQDLYNRLECSAQKLGSAFQKVNFLRDIRDDTMKLGRKYFPEAAINQLDTHTKQIIEKSIEMDFREAWTGVRQLPGRSKLSVALAYFYFKGLLRKIRHTSPEKLLSERIRLSNLRKYLIIVKVGFMYVTRLI